MDVRERTQAQERRTLCSYAAFSDSSAGRARYDEPCPMRTEFQRDRDRIIHCKAFRRLKHKTQVFLSPDGDHYRTRLTHTLEVSQIGRTIARALALNEDLTEAIALGHDLGHTPFGHAGERALADISGVDFRHNENSVRVVDLYEKDGRGLNLTCEVRDGMLCHTGRKLADTFEGQIVRLADRIAYINHDIDDALRAGILTKDDIPKIFREELGETTSERINTLVFDTIQNSGEQGGGGFAIAQSEKINKLMSELRDYMFESVYKNPVAKGEETKAVDLLEKLYIHFKKNTSEIPRLYASRLESDGLDAVLCDYISSMTDRYAVEVFKEVFIPKSWHVI